MPEPDVDVTIIGAGVVGLAIAAAVARPERRVLLLERHPKFGQEVSSRHSGIIHAGIYYPRDSLKATLCVRGRRLLYELCDKRSIPYRKSGKLIVATDDGEVAGLELLLERGTENGVEGLRLISREEVKALEPNVEAVAAIHSTETGIMDDYSLMRYFLGTTQSNGALVAFNKEVIAIEPLSSGYRVEAREGDERTSVATRVLINCAGLAADRIAGLAGIEVDASGYRLHYCLGEYFSLRKRGIAGRPVYPLPEAAGLGVHLTPDLEGGLRLGPGVRYVDSITYAVDPSRQHAFFDAARRYLPSIEYGDLAPDFAGVRPKLQGPGEAFRDFIISHEAEKGLPGLINLIGIESPGLTASPAIAELVATMVEEVT